MVASTGEHTLTDGEGRFSLALPPGRVEVAFSAPRHAPLKVTLALAPGEVRRAEFRMLPRPGRYESTAAGAAPHEGDRVSLTDEELHQAPGTLGDPFRAVALLPGVATPLPLLPLFVVRGASPGMNGFFLDGMRVPELFHLLVGGGVVHPRMIDRIDFYPGAYDASLGHYAGGVIDAETRPARADGPHGELELRLYDVALLVEAPLPGGLRVAAAGRFGYPGPILHLADPHFDVEYGDYLLRVDWRWLTVEALGSYDDMKVFGFGDIKPSDLGAELRETFHRLQLRARRAVGRVELDGAVVGGLDEASGISGTGVRKLSLGARGELRAKLPHLRLRAGFDGEVSRFTAQRFVPEGADTGSVPDEYGDFTGDRDGVVAGAFAVGTLDVAKGFLSATAGVRADVYHAGPVTLLGVDPRFSVEVKPFQQLRMRAGFGLYQQPPSFPVALPGIDTFALQLGLQRAWQGAVTVEGELPGSLTAGATGYYQRFYNVTDPVPDLSDYATCRGPSPAQLAGLAAELLRTNDGAGFGMELLLRKHKGRVTGWIAYTLSRAERTYSCGLRPADFDQTHVVNVVLQVRLPWQVMAGVRWFFSTGRPVTLLDPVDPASTPRNNVRLHGYLELDVRLDREWIFERWALSLFVEVLNATYSTAGYGVYYPTASGVPDLAHPQIFSSPWVLPSVGARGRF